MRYVRRVRAWSALPVLIAVLISSATAPSAVAATRTGPIGFAGQAGDPIVLSRGVIERTEYYDTGRGRQRAEVLTVDLDQARIRLGVVEAGDRITNPADETVSSMARRTGAIAGVNGDYFEIHGSGRPLGGVISDGVLFKSPRPDYNAQLGVLPDGSVVLGQQNFTGSITDGPATTALASVNVVNDVAAGGITEITTAFGAAGGLPTGTLVIGHLGANGLVVDAVRTGVRSLPALTGAALDLFGGGAGGQWLADTVRPGQILTVGTRISPDNDLSQLVSGAAMLVRDGRSYRDPTGTPPRGVNPETAIGLSRNGKRLIIVTFDGRESQTNGVGVTPTEAGQYLISLGAYTGELFDGGGSTEMVVRQPGARTVSVRNTPSDGRERPVANGIFVYGNG